MTDHDAHRSVGGVGASDPEARAGSAGARPSAGGMGASDPEARAGSAGARPSAGGMGANDPEARAGSAGARPSAGGMGAMSGPPLLTVEDVSVRFGALLALSKVSLEVRRREVLAIIGPNGAGKTTLLNVISGFYHPYEGRIVFDGRERTHLAPPDVAALGIARTFQNVALFRGMSVLDNLMTGRLLKMRGHFLLDAVWWGPAKRQELANRAVVERIIDFLEIQAIRKTPAGKLPYGLQKRVELGRALAAEPTLLLLDEPMAGMNVEEKEDMSRFILDVNSEFGTTIALIEHDMGVVMDICDRVVVLDYGRKIADGTPEVIRKDQAVLDAYLGATHG
jgi:branched-chain amino acid transport system ATP-binding protein